MSRLKTDAIRNVNASVDGITLDTSGNVAIPNELQLADKIVHTGDTNTLIRFPSADTVSVETGGSIALYIDSSQKLLAGTTSSRNVAGGAAKLQVEAASSEGISLTRTTDDNGAAYFSFGKVRTGGANSGRCIAGDNIGSISWNPSDGGDLNHAAAEIQCLVATGIGSNDVPGDLVFKTNGGATSAHERLRIDYRGAITVGKRSDIHSSSLLAKLGIDCQGSNVLADPGVASNYGLAFYNDPTTNHANGIGFFNDDGSTCGGYILHQDKGSGNLGDLVFGTSAVSDTPVERLRITSAGKIHSLNAVQSGGNSTGGFQFDAVNTACVLGIQQPSSASDANAAIQVFDGTSNNLRINYSGLIKTSEGINFSAQTGTSATGAATTGDETLDHYEEGTWTPVANFATSGSVTVGGGGHFTRVGRVVTICWTFYTTGLSSPSGNFTLTGLPFSCLDNTNSRFGSSFAFIREWNTDMPNFRGLISGGTTMYFYKQATNGASSSQVQGSDFASGSSDNYIYGSATYMAA